MDEHEQMGADETAEISTEIAAHECGITTLYHYEPFNPDYLIAILRDYRVHCSDPSRLNDPWDCQPAFDTSILQDPIEAQKAIAQLQSLVPAKPIHPRKDALMALQMRTLPSYPKIALDRISEFFGRYTRERWRIYCLTPHPDSTLMWSHYANNHKGICLEFSCENNLTFAYAMKVLYRCSYPKWALHQIQERPTQILLTKSDAWAYEEEYRLIARTKDNCPGQKSAYAVADGDYLRLPEHSLLSVIAGSAADYRLIKTIVQEYMPELPVKRAVRVPNAYQLRIADKPDDPLSPRLFRDLDFI